MAVITIGESVDCNFSTIVLLSFVSPNRFNSLSVLNANCSVGSETDEKCLYVSSIMERKNGEATFLGNSLNACKI